MLRSFQLANHKSIRDEQDFILLPAYDKSKPAVSVAAVFGANASGKSTLLDGLHWMRRAVLESFSVWEPGLGVPRTPFRLELDAARPSSYVIELQLDDVRYLYGFEVDDERVRQEWLYTYPHNRRRVVFEREGNSIRLGSTVADARSREETLAGLTRDNALLLSVAAHSNQRETLPVYQWLRRGVRVADQRRGTVIAGIRDRINAGGALQKSTLALIRSADLGICDVQTDAYAEPPKLWFVHHGGSTPLEFDEESAGTQTWLAMLSVAFGVLEQGGLLIVDELDRSLHPHLSASLVNLFRDPHSNPLRAQLLFTTHDTTLLDEDTLGRDEIWFVEKDPDSGATRLFPLTDFHPRKNENTERRYLAGSYGAVPVVSEVDMRDAMSRYRQAHDAA